MHEAVPVVMRNRSQILKVPGIRQLVKNSHWQTLLCQPLQHKGGTDEARPACYQNWQL
jgi:cell division inhibitor SulA